MFNDTSWGHVLCCTQIMKRAPCTHEREVALYNSGAVPLSSGSGMNVEHVLSINQYHCVIYVGDVIVVFKLIRLRREPLNYVYVAGTHVTPQRPSLSYSVS